jgi:hypothetical protein
MKKEEILLLRGTGDTDCQPVGSYPCIREADVFNEVSQCAHWLRNDSVTFNSAKQTTLTANFKPLARRLA